MTPEARTWHALEVDAALAALDTKKEGLSEEQASARLERYGPNRLPPPARRGALARFFAQFHNLLIYVLIASAAITAALGHAVDASVIAGVVIINAIVGFIQEGKAEQALEAIRNMLSLAALALRDGARRVLPAEELVPGDVVLLAPGDKVPADLRLFEARNLRIDEAALTGESVPVEKSSAPVEADAPLGDRAAMAWSGTLVTYGQGRGVVVATGAATELGRISALLEKVEEISTPLLRQIGRFGRWLTGAILAVSAATFALGYFWRGFAAADMFLAAVGIAVAAIPEALPAIMTITLAIGVRRMARRNAIVRRLPAVETLGSVTVICSDKTGTLTKNEMAVHEVVLGAATEREFARAALLCSDGIDPTELALEALAGKAGLNPLREYAEWPRLDAIPFESENRYMATLHHAPDGTHAIFVKGAPERILEMCDAAAWRDKVERLARAGMRVLAVAGRRAPDSQERLELADVDGGFALLGLAGIIDPPREEAIAAVRQCREAGIRVKMITGDHAVTAVAIAGMLGIEREDVLARASPEDKLRLVSALQAEGEVVAMTGDGVNDAPALKRADVGVAMGGKGTEAAKEAADMVLADDNFASIERAVEEGRTVYDNLKKTIVYLLPTNGGEALAVIGAVVLGMTLPITPVQILWINMVTETTLSLALAFDPTEAGVMRRPPRDPREPLLSGYLVWRIVFVSLLLFGGTLGLFLWEVQHSGDVFAARAAAVNALVMGEIVYLFNSRRLTESALNADALFGNRVALVAVAVLAALQLGFTYLAPMQALFGTAAMDATAWALVLAFGVGAFLLVELEKYLLRRRRA
ncbi:MAG TPA: HAD-IC family P-type ATPase [Burkholderiales bacterium]|nr:HAD-IC family P-type ATPase [Burkholderiales bacterium]